MANILIKLSLRRIRMLSLISILVSVTLFSLKSDTLITGSEETPSFSSLHVSGKKIIDESGSQVLLRGFNIWSAQIFDEYPSQNFPLTVERFQQISGWGFNVIRIPLWWGANIEHYQDQPGVYDEENLQKLEQVVHYAGEANLYVILSVRVSGGPGTDWGGWPTHSYLLTSEGLTRYCNFIEMLIQRFDPYPPIIGFNPWHFPFHGEWDANKNFIISSQYYKAITPSMISSVRQYSNKIIFYSPMLHGLRGISNQYPHTWDTGEFAFISPISDPLNNAVYEHDGYWPLPVSLPDQAPENHRQYNYPDWNYDIEDLRIQISFAKAFSDQYNVPMMMGEFGLQIHIYPEASVRPIRQSRIDYLDTKLTILDEYGDYNWLYWLYSNNEVPEGILEADLTPSAVLPVLQKHIQTNIHITTTASTSARASFDTLNVKISGFPISSIIMGLAIGLIVISITRIR